MINIYVSDLTRLRGVVLQDEHPAVPEAAVIGFPHEIKGEGER